MLDRNLVKELLKDESLRNTKDLQSFLKSITKEVLEIALENEMDDHLGYSKNESNTNNQENYRNGKTTKNVKSSLGNIELTTPRDRQSSFSPEIIKKRKTDITGIEEKVISMYSHGMSTRDISMTIDEMYGYNLSAESISAITDKIVEKAKEWKSKPLETNYAIVYMDGIVLKQRVDGVVRNVTVYVLLGIDMYGIKSCLSICPSKDSESSRYWLTVMNELKNRGLKDVLIFSVDNLNGLSEAITSAYPKSEIQKCIVHQIRNSLKFVSYKDYKKVTQDLKSIYNSESEEVGRYNLELFSEKWDKQYPHISKSWKDNWSELSTFFKYSEEIRKIIYTTNPIESFNRNIRKFTKTKNSFPTEDALLKVCFLAVKNTEKKWTQPIRNWGKIFSELSIYFSDRIDFNKI